MKTLALIPLFFVPALSLADGEKTIYGSDDRKDFYQVVDREEMSAMRSAVSIFRASSLSGSGETLAIAGAPFSAESRGICPGERFFEQRAAAFCSGTLIAPDLVLTAGHCMGERDKPASRCGTARFVFGFSINREGIFPETVNNADVYSCAKVEIYANNGRRDYAVVRLDRPARDRPPAWLHTDGPPEVGSRIFTVGGPYGLPLKVIGRASVRFVNGNGVYFGTNLDTSGGNSGGGIFNARTGWLIGVHTHTLDPDLKEVPLPAGHGLPDTDKRVLSGKCKTMITLEREDGNGKKGVALSAIPGLRALLAGDSPKEAVLDLPAITDISKDMPDFSRFGSLH